MSTVHVTDVCRALWHLTSHGNSGGVFNVADKGDSSKCQKVSSKLYLVDQSQGKLHPNKLAPNKKSISPQPEVKTIECVFQDRG